MRTLGGGTSATALLHGITGSGDIFGAGYDRLARDSRMVVPDLLGFGASLDLDREDFSLEAHLDALDDMLGVLGLDQLPLTVVGHSMGAVLALHWAARRPAVHKVVTLCAPLYISSDEVARHLSEMGWLEKLFALETPLATRTCALMCRYRWWAQWLAVVISPQWPVPIARQGVLHTWDAYLGGMNGIIQRSGWLQVLDRLDAAHVPVLMLEGARDPVPVAGRTAALADRFARVETREHPRAGHDLPVSHPGWCAGLVDAGLLAAKRRS